MIVRPRFVYGVPVSFPTVSGMSIGTNFWHFTHYSGEEPMIPNNEIDWNTAYANGDDIWNPDWMDEISIYSTFRFMNWVGTNNNAWGLDEDWDNRRLPTDETHQSMSPNPIGFFNHGSNRPGLAYEWLIDLCNRANKHMWINVRHRSRHYYWENLAHLIADKLNPGLKVYVEYSNETWNSVFDQFQYLLDLQAEWDVPGLSGNQWQRAQALHIHLSFELFEVFQNVFEEYNRKDDVVRVIAIGGNYDNTYRYLTDTGEHRFDGAQGHRDEVPNPHDQWFDALAIAPYISVGDGAREDAYEEAMAQLALRISPTGHHGGPGRVLLPRLYADHLGVDLIGYEGGQHELLNSRQWAENPQIYDFYTNMFNTYADYFDGPFCHYAHTSEYHNQSGRGSWGTMEFTGDTHMPKYQAIRDWMLTQEEEE